MPIVELKMKDTETWIEEVEEIDIRSHCKEESKFWSEEKLKNTLTPVFVHFQGQVQDLQRSLRSLRNRALSVLFLVNITWIILLYNLSFSELENYGFDKRGLHILFLAVYTLIILVQFITLLCHRVVTLVHYLGRQKAEKILGCDKDVPVSRDNFHSSIQCV